MAYWLLKTEPESFSYSDLVRLGRDCWNGVKNFAAIKNINTMKPGDLAFIYHTGREKAIVGVAEVVSEAYPDPQEADKRFSVIDVKPRYQMPRPVTLKEIKQNSIFRDWELVRQPRLSVMPVIEEHWKLLHTLADKKL